MTKSDFTKDEINMIAIYKGEFRKDTMWRLISVSRFFMDKEMRDTVESCVKKLNQMTEQEYREIRFETVS